MLLFESLDFSFELCTSSFDFVILCHQANPANNEQKRPLNILGVNNKQCLPRKQILIASVKLTSAPGVEVGLRPLSAINKQTNKQTSTINLVTVRSICYKNDELILLSQTLTLSTMYKCVFTTSMLVFSNKREFLRNKITHFQKERNVMAWEQHNARQNVMCSCYPSCYLKPNAPFATGKHTLTSAFYHFPGSRRFKWSVSFFKHKSAPLDPRHNIVNSGFLSANWLMVSPLVLDGMVFHFTGYLQYFVRFLITKKYICDTYLYIWYQRVKILQ